MAELVENNGNITEDVKLLELEPEVLEKQVPEKVEKIEKKQVEKKPIIKEGESEDSEEDTEEFDEIPEDLKEYIEPEEDDFKPKDELSSLERPTYTDIKKEYPEFFKKFPALRDMLYREAQYSELFPSIADAKEVAENNEVFNSLRQDILEGDGKQFVESLKDSKSLDSFAKKFLTNLSQTDQNLHWQVISPVLQNVVRSVYNAGKKTGNENLLNAAEWVSDYLFDNTGIASGVASLPEEKKEDDTLKRDREAFENQKFNDFRISTAETVYNESKRELLLAFKDVKNPVIKDALVQKALNNLDSAITADKLHMASLASLWKKVPQSKYSSEIKTRIISASLARVKSLIPSLSRRLMAEAQILPASEIKRRQEVKEKQLSRREPGGSGKAPDNRPKMLNPKSVDFKRTSDLDILNDKVTFKRS